MSDENAIIDEQIQLKITELRETHHACTARAVANVLGASPDVIRYRCSVLRDKGLITWDDMPGSLRLVDQADAVPVLAPSTGEAPPASTGEPSAAAAAKPRTKKAAPRKATSRTKPTGRKPKSV